MNRILVAIDGRRGAWGAMTHACSLAKRIRVDLFVLLVQSPVSGRQRPEQGGIQEAVRKRLALMIEAAKSEGITIHFYLTEGDYEEEVISFVNSHRIALLVLENSEPEPRVTGRETPVLRSLRHRLRCTLEVVAPIKPLTDFSEKT